jgi:polar amino acid transport system substrate-binding protein
MVKLGGKDMTKDHAMLILATLLLAFAVAIPSAGLAEKDKLVFATEAAYAPFNRIGDDGRPTGFDIEIGNALCTEMEAECSWVIQDWDGIIPALMAKKFDAIVSSMSMTAERKKRIDFTIPYYVSAARFMVAKDSDITETTPEALSGKRIGTQRASSQGAWLEDLYGEKSELVWYNTVDEAYLDLASGRLDATISFQIPLQEWIDKSEQGKCCRLAGEPIYDEKYFGEGHGIAVRKGEEDLRERFNKAILALYEKGAYQKINAKYFTFDLFPEHLK